MVKLSVIQLNKNEIIKCKNCLLKLKTEGTVYFSLDDKTLCYACTDLAYLADHSGEEDWEE